MPSSRAIIRRLRSLNGGCGQSPMMPPFDAEAESDRRRFYLAEELLKIRAEQPGYLPDHAAEAMAAAEILYPEPPESEEAANG